ncbi:MAG TPA: glycosyltransferase family 1 protein [Gemmatimonadaceae bacterium]|nr:glycosyltransferase family 1 protein [Gemmatimonadaceae bacterium]
MALAADAADARGLRLALFTDTFAPQVNGVARTLERLVAAVEARGGTVRVETVEDPDATLDRRVHRWASTPFWAYPQLRMANLPKPRAIAAMRRWRPTLIHAVTPFGVGLAGRAAARALGLPLVTSYHTAFDAYLRHYRLSALDAVAWPYLRWFHNSGLRSFVPTVTVARQLTGLGFRNLRVWGRGVDPRRFHPRFRSAAMRAQMGAADADIVVGYVGRIAPEKGLHEALRAIAPTVEAAGGRMRVAIAGDGPDEARCRAAAPAAWFAGALRGDALSAFYASLDLLVFPSTTETFGNVVLEAMASGVPVIAPNVGATLELAHARSAALFDAARPDSIGDVVRDLATDPARRAALAAAGLREAAARSWDAVWDGLVADYREAITEPMVRVA